LEIYTRSLDHCERKISEEWFELDHLELMKQLGIMAD
jgi:hypothetical protein